MVERFGKIVVVFSRKTFLAFFLAGFGFNSLNKSGSPGREPPVNILGGFRDSVIVIKEFIYD